MSGFRWAEPRNLYFLAFNVVSLLLFYGPVSRILSFSFHNDLYSYIILIPFISAYLVFVRRNEIFSAKRYAFAIGIQFLLLGIFFYTVGMHYAAQLQQEDYLSLMTSSVVVFYIGGFTLCYGVQTLREARFPLLFLTLMIPLPTFLLEKIVFFLQSGSAEVTERLFRMIGIPLYRDGFFFHLPGTSIEIAKECSGIRSSMALFILGILLGHFFLKSLWKKVFVNALIIPIVLIKNGLRIITLSLLAIYVDPSFLTNSALHRRGGILFFALAIAILAPILWLLRKTDSDSMHKLKL